MSKISLSDLDKYEGESYLEKFKKKQKTNVKISTGNYFMPTGKNSLFFPLASQKGKHKSWKSYIPMTP